MQRVLKLEKGKYLPSCQGVLSICSAVRGMDSQLSKKAFQAIRSQLGSDVHKGNATWSTALLDTSLLGYRCAAPATTGRLAAI